MRKIVLLLTLSLSFYISNAQHKQLWAKSVINQKAPKLVVEQWISESPEVKGKFMLIDFWATWCMPCRKVIPELNDFQEQFKKDLVVIGLSDEPVEKVKNNPAINIKYHSAVDTKRRMYNKLEIQGIPHCIIINPEGIVVWEGWPSLPGHELTEEVISNLITEHNQG
ncbi:TlpA family protein disulfide reductase [Pseudotamlana agarivorans]|uniref:TlpA family protein disulfide reductase n=1 Tax=Pseudotamlana agarivorans TaxID=481183 RepID=UPI000832E109|nr:TlpA disulfide reductase family protein [Tamlana agarivorans]